MTAFVCELMAACHPPVEHLACCLASALDLAVTTAQSKQVAGYQRTATFEWARHSLVCIVCNQAEHGCSADAYAALQQKESCSVTLTGAPQLEPIQQGHSKAKMAHET
jgi:hypothetical protein